MLVGRGGRACRGDGPLTGGHGEENRDVMARTGQNPDQRPVRPAPSDVGVAEDDETPATCAHVEMTDDGRYTPRREPTRPVFR